MWEEIADLPRRWALLSLFAAFNRMVKGFKDLI